VHGCCIGHLICSCQGRLTGFIVMGRDFQSDVLAILSAAAKLQGRLTGFAVMGRTTRSGVQIILSAAAKVGSLVS